MQSSFSRLISFKGAIQMSTHILAIGSDQNMMNTLEFILEAANFKVTRAVSTFDSEENIDKALSPFHLLIVDTTSSGTSCRELTARFNSSNFPVPVILILSHLERGKLRSACNNGNVSCIEKPVSRDTLLDAVNTALDKKIDNNIL